MTTDGSVTLSVIVPIRLTAHHPEIVERLGFSLSDEALSLSPSLSSSLEFVVVDDGSDVESAARLRERCSELGLRYLATEASPRTPFNLARARNTGARFARGRLLLFLDVDLLPYDGFYRDILIEAEVLGMARRVDSFLMCPVLYLTERGVDELTHLPGRLRKAFFINAMLSCDGSYVERFSHGTSVILVNRHYYLCRGGQDERFAGWGYEDYEFTTRLMRHNPQFPVPEHWSSMAGNFMSIDCYSGWKAAYRLHGDWLSAKGIYLLHAPHPVSKRGHHAARNQRLLERQLRRGAEAREPDPIPYPDAGVSLLFGKNPFCFSREFAPFLGWPVFADERKLGDSETLDAFIRGNGIERVVFGNPYANDALLSIYRWCRKKSFPFLVCERGALPDSVYHDRNGFLSDGDSYSSERWDIPLPEAERHRAVAYIESIRHGDHMLEKQAGRQDVRQLRARLGIGPGQKVVLVPFQQPNDTTVRFFSGAVGGFEHFHRIVSGLSGRLGTGWRVVYKKHPVEDRVAYVDGAVNADDANIYDLIEMADALVVINSGVGVYGMMFEKPVYILGQAWYAHAGLNVSVTDPDGLAGRIATGFTFDRERMLRFVHYLRYRFYSFGTQIQHRVRGGEGSMTTATLEIDYYELRGWSEEPLYFTKDNKPVSLHSPLFDRYRGKGLPALPGIPRDRGMSTAVREARMRKLRERPLRFFLDAIRNRLNRL